jgi:hypothetical protein
MLQTVDTHAGISIDLMDLIKDVCSRTVLLYQESNHSTVANDTSLIALFVVVNYGQLLLHMCGPAFFRKQMQLLTI